MDGELWELYQSSRVGKQRLLKQSFLKLQKKFCTASSCPQRGLLQAFDQFCKNKRGVCGLLPHCRRCHNAKQHRKGNKEPSNVKERRFAATRNVREWSRHYQVAIAQIESFAHRLISATVPLELKQWQDGTLSDVGVRPRGGGDSWLLLQIKGTARDRPPFTWIGCKRYEGMSIVALTACPSLIYFFPHEDSIKTSNIRISDSTRCSFTNNPIDINNLAVELKQRWNTERKYSEHEARMQCNVKSQRELVTIMLDERFHPSCKHEWPMFCTETDRWCDGLRVQHKTAFWDSTNGWYKSNLYKRAGNEHVPYCVGDVELFKISTVHEGLRLFIQWTIPASDMDAVFEKLDRGDGEVCGQTTIQLSLLGADGENSALHHHIFGRCVPDQRADRRSAQYVEIHSLPATYCIPQCMRGRDPVLKFEGVGCGD